MLTAFDAESWGTGGAGAAAGFPLPYIYQFPNRRRTHKDVFINAGQQRAMRAPGHPQGCFLTEILMDELADRVKMDPVEFRIKNLPPEAPNAMWRRVPRARAPTEFGWDKRHPTGDPTPGPIKTGMGVCGRTVGRRRPRLAGALRDRVRRQRRRARAARRTSAPARARSSRWSTAETLGLPAGAGQAGDRRHDVPVQRRLGRQHDGRAASARRSASPRSRRSTR